MDYRSASKGEESPRVNSLAGIGHCDLDRAIWTEQFHSWSGCATLDGVLAAFVAAMLLAENLSREGSMKTFLTIVMTIVGLSSLNAAEWQAGVAEVDITPDGGLWLAGYASRSKPADGTLHPLFAKALALRDTSESLVIVTLDLIGDNFGRALADRVRVRCAAEAKSMPREILFNFSHTHSGPVTRLNDGATVTYGTNQSQRAAVARYTSVLEDNLVNLIVDATDSLQPVHLHFGEGVATFAANRRQQFLPNGPVDHTVPVLSVLDGNSKPLAILFGYACHTATLKGDYYKYSGDYAGFAQIALEAEHPTAVAMFMMGCGGDANPEPRGTVALAEQHGRTLASAVNRVLAAEMRELDGPLSVRFGRIDVDYVDPPTMSELESRRGKGGVYTKRLTEVLIGRLQRQGVLESSYPFPIHVVRFGDDLSLVALSGETVVDYAIRLRRELPHETLWIAGYCNEVFAYIPSERVLAEGGYEGGGAMQYFGTHGPFKPGLEDRIVNGVKELVAKE